MNYTFVCCSGSATMLTKGLFVGVVHIRLYQLFCFFFVIFCKAKVNIFEKANCLLCPCPFNGVAWGVVW